MYEHVVKMRKINKWPACLGSCTNLFGALQTMQRKEMLGKYLEALSKILMVLQMSFEKQASLHFRLLTQIYLGFA